MGLEGSTYQVGWSIKLKCYESSSLRLNQGLKWFKAAPIPAIEHRRLHMVRERQKQLPLHTKKVPVVSQLRGNLLNWLKARAIPLVNLGSNVFHSLHDHSLSK